MDTKLQRTWRSPVVLAVILALGAAAVWFFVTALGGSLISEWLPGHPREDLLVSDDGQIVIERYDPSSKARDYRTLEGRPLPNFSYADADSGSWVSEVMHPGRYPVSWLQRISGFVDDSMPHNLWYLVEAADPKGRAYLVGFDSRSKERIGYIGRDGFHSDVPDFDQQFEQPIQTTASYRTLGRAPYSDVLFSQRMQDMHLLSAGEVFAVNLNERSATRLNLSEKPLAISRMYEPYPDDLHSIRRQLLGVRSERQLLMLDGKHEVVRTFPIPEGVGGRQFSLYQWWGDRPVLIVSSWLYGVPASIYWLDAQGQATRNQDVLLLRDPPPDPRTMAWLMLLTLPSLVLYSIFLFVFAPLETLLSNLAPDFATALRMWMSAGWPTWLTLLAASALLAVYCYRRHSRFSEHGAPIWAAFVLLFGLPGIAAWWLHRRWPATEHCQHCGTVSPRDRDACLSCSTPFPLPAVKGIELLA